MIAVITQMKIHYIALKERVHKTALDVQITDAFLPPGIAMETMVSFSSNLQLEHC